MNQNVRALLCHGRNWWNLLEFYLIVSSIFSLFVSTKFNKGAYLTYNKSIFNKALKNGNIAKKKIEKEPAVFPF